MSDWSTVRHLSQYAGGVDLHETTAGPLFELAHDRALNSELEAAIEYKIATSGMDGVTEILNLVSEAVRRRVNTVVEEAV